MPISEEREAITIILEKLRNEGEEWLRRPGDTRRELATQMLREYTHVPPHKIVQVLKNSGELPETEFIFMKPPRKDPHAVLALWCRWNFDNNKFGYYIGLWTKFSPFPNNDNGDAVTGFLGHRYETPEESGDTHDYYHAQPSRSMNSRDNVLSNALPISDTFPAFPLIAKDSVQLLISAIMSVYGKSITKTFYDELLDSGPKSRSNATLITSFKSVLSIN